MRRAARRRPRKSRPRQHYNEHPPTNHPSNPLCRPSPPTSRWTAPPCAASLEPITHVVHDTYVSDTCAIHAPVSCRRVVFGHTHRNAVCGPLCVKASNGPCAARLVCHDIWQSTLAECLQAYQHMATSASYSTRSCSRDSTFWLVLHAWRVCSCDVTRLPVQPKGGCRRWVALSQSATQVGAPKSRASICHA